jgi:hypothetical protein
MSDSVFLYVILGIIFAIFILALICICVCRRKNDPGETSAIPIGTPASTQPSPEHLNSRKTKVPRNLIPPLFFTEQLIDPLLQDDLREHLGQPPVNVTYV